MLILQPQLSTIMMVNLHVAPKTINIMHIAYFLKGPRSYPDTHVANFDITCTTNDNHVAKFQEVFIASLQEDAFALYQRQLPFAN